MTPTAVGQRSKDRYTTKMTLERRFHRLEKAIQFKSYQLEKTYNWRLAIGVLLFVLLTVSTIASGFRIEIFAIAILVPAFVYFYKKGREYKLKISRLKAYQEFINRQHQRSIGDFKLTDKSIQPNINSIENDLDLFGPRSLHGFLDETLSLEGAQLLKSRIQTPKLNLEFIKSTQADIQNLNTQTSKISHWISNCKANSEELNLHHLLDYNVTTAGFKNLYRLTYFVFFLALTGFVLLLLNQTSFTAFSAVWGVFGILSLIGAFTTKESFTSALRLSRKINIYLVYFKGQKEIFPSTKDSCITESIKEIEKTTEYLSIQSHPLVVLVVNFILPWNIFFGERFQRLAEDIRRDISENLNHYVHNEYLACLTTTYHYQSSTLPSFSNKRVFEADDLFHPLISQNESVSNSFSADVGSRMGLITGSNMSGKSTFLRTLGLNQMMALLGGPVCASKMTTHLAPIKSSIRISDQIEEKTSYFYAEVLRIKNIVESALSDQPIIFLIDEIFKGTNNQERRVGSEAIIKTLLKTQNIGLVTTHDLDLTSLSKISPEIRNYHFSDELREGQYFFSYRLQSGPSPTTNALKIMKDAGLPIS